MKHIQLNVSQRNKGGESMKCISCKKESVTLKLGLCDDCIQDIYKDYIGMLKEKSEKGINVTKEVHEFIDKMILPYNNPESKV